MLWVYLNVTRSVADELPPSYPKIFINGKYIKTLFKNLSMPSSYLKTGTVFFTWVVNVSEKDERPLLDHCLKEIPF